MPGGKTPLHETTFGWTFTELEDDADHPHPSLIPASQEVYAAAATLLPNGRTHSGIGHPNYAAHHNIDQHAARAAPGNGYHDGPDVHQPQYSRSHSSYNNLTYPSAGASGDGKSSYIPQSVETWQEPARPAPLMSLHFGSDKYFPPSSYTLHSPGPKRDPSETIITGLELNETLDSNPNTQPSSPVASRKRRKLQVDVRGVPVAHSSDESDDGAGPSRRRRRQSEDDGSDEDDKNGLRKNGKGKPGSAKKQVMESPIQQTPTSATTKGTRENLTEEQKRNNHIQSEKKRRDLIKRGYDKLERLVPELRQGGLSKSQILEETAAFMEKVKQDNDELRNLMQALDHG